MMSRLKVRAAAPVIMAGVLYAVGVTLSAGQGPENSNTAGRDLFTTYCASCHGATGQGNGPAAAALRQAPADLTRFAMQNGGTFPTMKLERIIDGRDVVAHGSREMPVWGSAFKFAPDHPAEDAVKARITAIVRYLEFIQVRHG